MARCDTELPIGRVIWAGLDFAKPLTACCVIGVVEMQFIKPLARKDERAFAAIDLEIMLHLAARGDPIGLNRPRCAIFKPQKGAPDIIDIDLAGGSRGILAVVNHGDAIPHNAGDWP